MKRYSPKDPAHVGGAVGGELAREQGRLGRCRMWFMRPKVAEPGAEGAEGGRGRRGGAPSGGGVGAEGEGGVGVGGFSGVEVGGCGRLGLGGGDDAIVYVYIYKFVPRTKQFYATGLALAFSVHFFSHTGLLFCHIEDRG